ncbi:unnamed protein product [Polarella glacialis]|uniref:Uncharacterized protein n=2 Tax=Polarella glacialis TaxID=89957 RepID=A0A813I5I8_POLGL|nr:unnamed protein product [Polarella glacialis]
MVWKEWSECWADRYSSADYIAVIDTDVVFVTFGIEQLLFARGASNSVRPIIWGHANEIYFPHTVLQLGYTGGVDFMDSFPLVVQRSHFADLRQFLVKRFGRPDPPKSGGDAFDWAFLEYVKAVRAGALDEHGGECPSFHAMIGSFIWNERRESYAWSIRHGHLQGIPLEHRCPRLRVTCHVPYWGHDNLPDYHITKVKWEPQSLRASALPSLGYAARAISVIYAGLCEVPWMQRDSLKKGKDDIRAPLVVSVRDGSNVSFLSHQFGVIDIQREMCSHATGEVDGVSDSFQRLLSWRYPASPILDAEASFCGGCRPSELAAEYRRLMSGIVFAYPFAGDRYSFADG